MLREEGAKAPGKILRLSGFRAGSARPGHKGKDGSKGAEACLTDKKAAPPASVLIVSFETSRRAIFLKAISKDPGTSAARQTRE